MRSSLLAVAHARHTRRRHEFESRRPARCSRAARRRPPRRGGTRTRCPTIQGRVNLLSEGKRRRRPIVPSIGPASNAPPRRASRSAYGSGAPQRGGAMRAHTRKPPAKRPSCATWARCAHRATRLSPCRRSHGPISRRFRGRPACAHFIHSPTNCTRRFSFSFAYRDKSSSIRAFRENIGLPITRIDRMMHWRDTRAAGDIARCRPAGCAADDHTGPMTPLDRASRRQRHATPTKHYEVGMNEPTRQTTGTFPSVAGRIDGAARRARRRASAARSPSSRQSRSAS